MEESLGACDGDKGVDWYMILRPEAYEEIERLKNRSRWEVVRDFVIGWVWYSWEGIRGRG